MYTESFLKSISGLIEEKDKEVSSEELADQIVALAGETSEPGEEKGSRLLMTCI